MTGITDCVGVDAFVRHAKACGLPGGFAVIKGCHCALRATPDEASGATRFNEVGKFDGQLKDGWRLIFRSSCWQFR